MIISNTINPLLFLTFISSIHGAILYNFDWFVGHRSQTPLMATDFGTGHRSQALLTKLICTQKMLEKCEKSLHITPFFMSIIFESTALYQRSYAPAIPSSYLVCTWYVITINQGLMSHRTARTVTCTARSLYMSSYTFHDPVYAKELYI